MTQAVLGAAVGFAVAGRRFGRKAAAWGALGGVLPDVDVAWTGLYGPFGEWAHHRGVTHSLFFGPVVGPLLGWLTWRGYRRWRPRSTLAADDALPSLSALWLFALATHPLLDLFTIYGTQLLAPVFSHRFALPGVAIIDPVYTLLLLVPLIAVLVRPRAHLCRLALGAGLVLSTAYLFYGLQQNGRAEMEARRQLGTPAGELRAYTTMFNPWLRRVVVVEPERTRIGFVSTWDPQPIRWHDRPRDDGAYALLDDAFATPEGAIFRRFASGPVLAELRPGGGADRVLRVLDLRYGFPGPTLEGFWGVDFHYDGATGSFTAVERVRVPRAIRWRDVEALVQASFGWPNGVF
ncbi:metal-dependent hydrolase [Marinivivus vitaminiproducens]|uniref:metal-dependent hydrolase n=1 Tax=Marinivivus vitaminiproducens TaxID=3035935 RepID=UPI0027A581D8|nr:metal-dependent hydrolase [Geminicoccaceae bacterium SCSIO 64248]